MPAGLGMAMPGALMKRKAQRGMNRACSGMVATEHCQAQDKGFGATRNSLAGMGRKNAMSLDNLQRVLQRFLK